MVVIILKWDGNLKIVWSLAKNTSVTEISNKYNIEFLDFNLKRQNYNLPDHRNDKKIADDWNETANNYEKRKIQLEKNY